MNFWHKARGLAARYGYSLDHAAIKRYCWNCGEEHGPNGYTGHNLMTGEKFVHIHEGMPAAKDFAVTAHELTHVVLGHAEWHGTADMLSDHHAKRTSATGENLSKELQAGMAAFMVCEAAGVSTAHPEEYLQRKLEHYRPTRRDIERATEAAALITEGLGI